MMKSIIKHLSFKTIKFKFIRSLLKQKYYLFNDKHYLARTFGFGMFLTFSPTFGVQLIAAAGMCLFLNLFKKLKINPITVFVLIFLTNPVTVLPIYTFYQYFGCVLVGCENISSFSNINDFLTSLPHFLYSFIIGSMLSAVIIGIIFYPVGYHLQKILVRKLNIKKSQVMSI